MPLCLGLVEGSIVHTSYESYILSKVNLVKDRASSCLLVSTKKGISEVRRLLSHSRVQKIQVTSRLKVNLKVTALAGRDATRYLP